MIKCLCLAPRRHTQRWLMNFAEWRQWAKCWWNHSARTPVLSLGLGSALPGSLLRPQTMQTVLPLVSSPNRTSHHINANHVKHLRENQWKTICLSNDSHNGPHHLGNWKVPLLWLESGMAEIRGVQRAVLGFSKFLGKIWKTSSTSLSNEQVVEKNICYGP